jgi:hypothetical protein
MNVCLKVRQMYDKSEEMGVYMYICICPGTCMNRCLESKFLGDANHDRAHSGEEILRVRNEQQDVRVEDIYDYVK